MISWISCWLHWGEHRHFSTEGVKVYSRSDLIKIISPSTRQSFFYWRTCSMFQSKEQGDSSRFEERIVKSTVTIDSESVPWSGWALCTFEQSCKTVILGAQAWYWYLFSVLTDEAFFLSCNAAYHGQSGLGNQQDVQPVHQQAPRLPRTRFFGRTLAGQRHFVRLAHAPAEAVDAGSWERDRQRSQERRFFQHFGGSWSIRANTSSVCRNHECALLLFCLL